MVVLKVDTVAAGPASGDPYSLLYTVKRHSFKDIII